MKDIPDLWQEYALMIHDPSWCDPSGLIPERPTMDETERRLAGQRTRQKGCGNVTLKERQEMKEVYGHCAATPARHRPR